MKKLGVILLVLFATSAVLFMGCKKEQGAAVSGAKQQATITVEVFDRGTDGGKTDPTNNKWTTWIKEKLLKDENIVVNFVAVPRWTETEALINLFAAGTAPDVCYTYSTDNIQMWADQGGIFDVAPYINTTLKDLNAFLGPDKAIPGKALIERQVDLSSGKIYAMPSRRMNVARRNIFIREDWLKELGIPLPTTTEQFWDALVAFKDKDPGKVGANRVVPFILASDRPDWNLGNIMDAFIDPRLSPKEQWINTVAERNFLVEGFKEGVRYANKMFNAGLIDKNFPLYKTMDEAVPVIKSGVVGAFCWDWDTPYRESYNLITDLQKNVPGGNYIPIDPIQSSDGITHKNSYDAIGVYYFIPASAKNTDAAMRYLNWFARYDNYHYIQTGPQGITHTIGSDGIIKLEPMAPSDPTWIMNSAQNIDYTMMMNGLFLESEEASIKALSAGYSTSADIISRSYTTALTNASPPIFVKTLPLTVAGPYVQTLQDKAKVILTQSITASSADFDRVYDAGIADWLSSGAEAIRTERRQKYPN